MKTDFLAGGILNWWDRQADVTHQAPACTLSPHSALKPAVARWTWGTGHTDLLCQTCLDNAFDYADEDVISEPDRVYWLDGSRALVAA